MIKQRYFLDTEENVEYTLDDMKKYYDELKENNDTEQETFNDWLNATLDYNGVMIEIYK